MDCLLVGCVGSHVACTAQCRYFRSHRSFQDRRVLVLALIWPRSGPVTRQRRSGQRPVGETGQAASRHCSRFGPLESLGLLGSLGKVGRRVCAGVVIVRSPRTGCWAVAGAHKTPDKTPSSLAGTGRSLCRRRSLYQGWPVKGKGARATHSRVLLSFQVRGSGDFQENGIVLELRVARPSSTNGCG